MAYNDEMMDGGWIVLVNRRYHRWISITSAAVELEITEGTFQLDVWQNRSELIKSCEGKCFRVKLAQSVDPLVELRLVELRGLVDDESSRPEVPPLEIGRVDTVPALVGEPQAVLTGTNAGNNTSDHLVIDGTAKEVPSG